MLRIADLIKFEKFTNDVKDICKRNGIEIRAEQVRGDQLIFNFIFKRGAVGTSIIIKEDELKDFDKLQERIYGMLKYKFDMGV